VADCLNVCVVCDRTVTDEVWALVRPPDGLVIGIVYGPEPVGLPVIAYSRLPAVSIAMVEPDGIDTAVEIDVAPTIVEDESRGRYTAADTVSGPMIRRKYPRQSG
jgi:hypothetical protein